MSERQYLRGQHRRIAVVGAIVAAGAAVVIGGSGAASGAGGPRAGASAGPPLAPGPTPTSAPATPRKPPEPPLGTIPAIKKRGQPIAMPLDPFTTSMSDLKLFDAASGLKAQACMRSLGFSGWTADTISPSGPGTYQEFEPLDYLDPATVARSGYPQTLVDKSEPTAGPKSAARPSQDGIRAFVGTAPRTAAGAAVPTGGCGGVGERQVKGSVTTLPVNARLLALQAKQYSMGDSRMKRLVTTWSTCMAQSGLSYTDPLSAQNDPRWGRRTSATPPGADERRVAAIDARCQQKIHLIGTFKALEIGYQRELVTADRAKLASAKAISARWIANAKAITDKE